MTCNPLSQVRASFLSSYFSIQFPLWPLPACSHLTCSLPGWTVHSPEKARFLTGDRRQCNPGVSGPWPAGCLRPTMATNAAEHKIVSLLKTLGVSFCDCVSQCIHCVAQRPLEPKPSPHVGLREHLLSESLGGPRIRGSREVPSVGSRGPCWAWTGGSGNFLPSAPFSGSLNIFSLRKRLL